MRSKKDFVIYFNLHTTNHLIARPSTESPNKAWQCKMVMKWLMEVNLFLKSIYEFLFLLSWYFLGGKKGCKLIEPAKGYVDKCEAWVCPCLDGEAAQVPEACYILILNRVSNVPSLPSLNSCWNSLFLCVKTPSCFCYWEVKIGFLLSLTKHVTCHPFPITITSIQPGVKR